MLKAIYSAEPGNKNITRGRVVVAHDGGRVTACDKHAAAIRLVRQTLDRMTILPARGKTA